MYWLNEQYANEKYLDDVRAAERTTKQNALLAHAQNKTASGLRRAVGAKLIAWGQQLQNEPTTIQLARATNG